MLQPGDPPAVEIINPDAIGPLLLTGDHAGNAVPQALGDLGLPPGEIARHIGWDIGVAGITRAMAARLKATAVMARYSRLVIDANRPLGHPNSIPLVSDGTPVPGNQELSDDDRRRRAAAVYWPYHHAVAEHIGRLHRMEQVPILLAMHSFTPTLNVGARPRPWHIGILFGRDERLSRHLLAGLRGRKYQGGDLIVGANEPYSGVTHAYGLRVHGSSQGLPHAELEIRQDLIATAEGQEHWATLLAEVLTPILAHADLKSIAYY